MNMMVFCLKVFRKDPLEKLILIWSMIIFQYVISCQFTWKCYKTVHSPKVVCVVVLWPDRHAETCTLIPVYPYAWHNQRLAVCVCVFCMYVTVVWTSLVSTTHMPVCSVQRPEWQLRGLGWAAGIVPFMVMTDGTRRDARLLQRTGRKSWGEEREQNWVRGREIESTRGSGKGVIEMEREKLRSGWISAALRGRAKEVGMELK